MGHLREMLMASGVAAELDSGAVPVIDGVRDLLAVDMVAGGTRRNHAFVSDTVEWGRLPEPEQLLLADAQTSGGLLIAVAAKRANGLIAALEARATLAAAIVGRATSGRAGQVTVG
jgi:selenide,water dikinase